MFRWTSGIGESAQLEGQTQKCQMPHRERAQKGSFLWPLGDGPAPESPDRGTHQAESHSTGLGWASPGRPESDVLWDGVPGRAGEGQGAPMTGKGLGTQVEE